MYRYVHVTHAAVSDTEQHSTVVLCMGQLACAAAKREGTAA